MSATGPMAWRCGCNDLLFAVRKRAGPALLVAVGLAQAQGQERGRIYLPLRGDRGARGRATRGVDGVVCGHIHHAEIRMIGDVLYLNDGDWVESCSALVEDAHGNMEILRWADPSQRRAQDTGSRFRLSLAGTPAAAACTRVGPSVCSRVRLPGVAAHLKILIVTDAWTPQVNGVVRTLEMLGKDLARSGPYGALHHAAGPAHLSAADLSRNPPGLVSARSAGRGRSANSRPMRCISPPKARWG